MLIARMMPVVLFLVVPIAAAWLLGRVFDHLCHGSGVRLAALAVGLSVVASVLLVALPLRSPTFNARQPERSLSATEVADARSRSVSAWQQEGFGAVNALHFVAVGLPAVGLTTHLLLHVLAGGAPATPTRVAAGTVQAVATLTLALLAYGASGASAGAVYVPAVTALGAAATRAWRPPA